VTGGGFDGNVPTNAVRELRSSVGFVQSASNPLPAQGGAATELLRAARDRATHALQHRDRAASAADYAWLARAASSEVARARALPLEGPDGRGSRGYVGIVLVPHSTEPSPVPSEQLARTVQAYLAQRAPAGIAGGIRILAPSYVEVGVRADVLPATADDAAAVEARVRASLAQFLHPLTGGADGRGWDFGRSIYLSDVAARLAAIEGVAAVQLLQLHNGPAVCGDAVPVEPDQLICAGELQLRIVVPSVPYALA
jgi:predicted phage baseplate assembly protein